MHRAYRSRSMAIGGICLLAIVTTCGLIAPARAQAQQVNGWTIGSTAEQFYPQWARPYMISGFNAGSGIAAGNNLFVAQTSLPQDLFGANLTNPAWRTSIVANYKSEPNTALFNGLYTTASFGVTSIRANPAGIPGLTNFSAGNDAVALSARAGVGLQLTPNITFEGSVGVTQLSTSPFR
jgi:hypothetical protein